METRDAIYGRRSIRKYADMPIPADVLREIIEAALMAPSGNNTQPWYFLAVQSDGQLDKLRKIFAEISVEIKEDLEQLFPRNPEVVSETRGFLKGLGNAKVCVLVFLLKSSDEYELTLVESAAAAIQTLCLMAYDKGIGSCWMTAPLTTGFASVLEKDFAPDKGKFVAAVTLGYPAVAPRAPKRKPGRFDII